MDFGEALALLKAGKKIKRAGWANVLWVVMMPALFLPPASTVESGPKVNARTAKYIGNNTPLNSQPYIAAMTSASKWQPGWLPSQADLFADDWMEAE